jgi:hypothetical protein
VNPIKKTDFACFGRKAGLWRNKVMIIVVVVVVVVAVVAVADVVVVHKLSSSSSCPCSTKLLITFSDKSKHFCHT